MIKDKQSKFLEDRMILIEDTRRILNDINAGDIDKVIEKYREKIEHDNISFISESQLDEIDYDDAIMPSYINIKREVKWFIREYDGINKKRYDKMIDEINTYTKQGLNDIRKNLKNEIYRLIRFTTYAHELSMMDNIYHQFGDIIIDGGNVKSVDLNKEYIMNLMIKKMVDKLKKDKETITDELNSKSSEFFKEIEDVIVKRFNENKNSVRKIKTYAHLLFILATIKEKQKRFINDFAMPFGGEKFNLSEFKSNYFDLTKTDKSGKTVKILQNLFDDKTEWSEIKNAINAITNTPFHNTYKYHNNV